MMSGQIPSNFANAVSPYAGIGSQPVGEESIDSKQTAFKAVEESADISNTANRRNPEEQLGVTDEKQRLEQEKAQKEKERQQNQQVLEQQQIRELASRDREVRNHEQAHAAAGGQYAGAPRYTYEQGPDGVNYAVSGSVSIDTSKVGGDPQATIEKAQLIRRAALAPADPSSQDRMVAAEATKLEAQARVELTALLREQAEKATSEAGGREEKADQNTDDALLGEDQLQLASDEKGARDDELIDESSENPSVTNGSEVALNETNELGEIFSRLAIQPSPSLKTGLEAVAASKDEKPAGALFNQSA